MSNMSYCRFQNTLLDLRDCENNLIEKVSEEEKAARRRLILVCVQILDQVGVEVEQSDKEIEDLIKQLDEDSDSKEEDNDEDE